MLTSDHSRPGIEQAQSVSRRLKRMFEPGCNAIGTLEEAQHLCDLGRAAVSDLYCRNVMRAVSDCAACAFSDEPADMRPLIQSLLAAFDGRLRELDHQAGVWSTWHSDRRRAERRSDYLRAVGNGRRRTYRLPGR